MLHLAFLAALLPTIFLNYYYQAITYDVIGGLQVSSGTDQNSTSSGAIRYAQQYLEFDEASPTPILSRTNFLARAVL